MKSKIIASTLIGLGFLLGASALSALAVWTGAPAGTPPNCPTNPTNPDGSANADYREGCNAPINAGATAQSKFGPLSTFGFSTIGGFNFLPSARLVDQPKVGQVLMADDSPVVVGGSTVSGLTIGKIKWGSVAGSGGSGGSGSGITFITPITVCPGAGFVSCIQTNSASTNNTLNDTNPSLTTITWNTFTLPSSIPSGIKSVILQATYKDLSGSSNTGKAIIYIRKDNSSDKYTLLQAATPNSDSSALMANQGFFPVSSLNTFDYGMAWTEWSNHPLMIIQIQAIGYTM